MDSNVMFFFSSYFIDETGKHTRVNFKSRRKQITIPENIPIKRKLKPKQHVNYVYFLEKKYYIN